MKIVAGSPFDELELPFEPPLDWPRLLRFFSGRASAGVEAVVDGAYLRSLHWNDEPGVLAVRRDPFRHCLIATVQGEASRALGDIAPRLRPMFDLDTRPAEVHQRLGQDPWLAALLAHAPGLRIAGTWSGFELVVRTIVGQQVSVKAATTITGRLVQRAGAPASTAHPAVGWCFPTPAALAAANLEQIGMPGKRVAALQGFAQAVAQGVISFDQANPDVPALRAALLALPGIGPWTVEYTAMRAWRDHDAWPGTDLVLMQAIAQRNPALARHAQQRAYTDAWRPWRAYAAIHLWNAVADALGAARGG